MQEFYFLFGIGLIWTIFAVVQDMRTREVANWLNFSLIGIALAYRAFYFLETGNWKFFVSGLLGFLVFFIIAHLFYYGKVFAGGDAKLLMGFGVILPYSNFNDLWYITGLFLFALLLFGAIWSLIYSVIIVYRSFDKFKKEFKYWIKKMSVITILLIFIGVILSFIDRIWILMGVVMVLLPLFFSYVKALDVCMVKVVKAKDLQEGDWLEHEVKIGKKIIKKSVHGLSNKEINLLIKRNKKVMIKDGVPFTPAFLLALAFIFYLLIKNGNISLHLFL